MCLLSLNAAGRQIYAQDGRIGGMKQQPNLLARIQVACYYLYLCTMQLDKIIAIVVEVLDLGALVDKPLAVAFYAAVGQAYLIARSLGYGLNFISIAQLFHPYDEFEQL
jgi:hypothetical protein